MMKKNVLLTLCLLCLVSCNKNNSPSQTLHAPGQVRKLMSTGTKIPNIVRPDITPEEFKSLLSTNLSKLTVIEAKNITDSDFIHNTSLTFIALEGMPQLTDQALEYLEGVEHLVLNSCPQITYKGILKLKSLKTLYLWKMPHLSDYHVAILRENKIRIVNDGRHKKYNSYSRPSLTLYQ